MVEMLKWNEKELLKLWLNIHYVAIQKNSEHFPRITKHLCYEYQNNIHIVSVTHHEIGKCACGQFLTKKSESILWVNTDDYY